MKLSSIALPLVPLVVLISGAEFLSQKGIVPPFILPAPSQVLDALVSDLPTFQSAFIETTVASGVGFLISAALGTTFALLLSLSQVFRAMFYPYAIFFQTVPIIAIAPLLVIWLGYGLPTVIASAFIVSVFPVIANSVLGLLSTDRLLLDLYQMLGAGRLQTLFGLRFRAGLPQILGGFKISAGLSVIGAIVGEFISGSGLGGVVDTARNQQRVDRVFAAVILAAVLGILFFALISSVSSLLLRHQQQK